MIGNRDLIIHRTLDIPLSIQFNHCGIQECIPGYHYGFTMRPYHLIHFVLEGSGTFQINDTTYDIHAGQAFYIPAGSSGYYHSSVENPWKYSWIGFFADSRNPFIKTLFQDSFVINIKTTLNELEQLLLSVIAVTDQRADSISSYRKVDFPGEQFVPITTEMQCLEANSKMLHLFSVLLKNNNQTLPSSCKEQNYASEAKAYIDAYYCEPLLIQDVANALHIHPNYLSSCFKKVYHQTPKAYLNSMRMERACMLLLQTDYPVSVIASAVGFSNAFQFSGMFKKYFHVSPANFRKSKQT